MKFYKLIVLASLVIVSCGQRNTKADAQADTNNANHDETIQTDSLKGTQAITDSVTSIDSAQSTQVYITHIGNKYHTADCRYSKDAQSISLQQAKASGKTACGICKPNSKTGDKQLRCSAKTKEGKQCHRMTTHTSGKCYQHQSN
jgi:hypothetical protein